MWMPLLIIRFVLVLLLQIVPEPVPICHFVRCNDQVHPSNISNVLVSTNCTMDRLCCDNNMDACHLILEHDKILNMSKHLWSIWACASTHNMYMASLEGRLHPGVLLEWQVIMRGCGICNLAIGVSQEIPCMFKSPSHGMIEAPSYT